MQDTNSTEGLFNQLKALSTDKLIVCRQFSRLLTIICAVVGVIAALITMIYTTVLSIVVLAVVFYVFGALSIKADTIITIADYLLNEQA